MMSKFITEQQLFELKYRLGGEYYNKPLAGIFLTEFLNFAKNNNIDLFQVIQPFFHRLLPNGIWQVKFRDESVLLIKKEQEDIKFDLNVITVDDYPTFVARDGSEIPCC